MATVRHARIRRPPCKRLRNVTVGAECAHHPDGTTRRRCSSRFAVRRTHCGPPMYSFSRPASFDCRYSTVPPITYVSYVYVSPIYTNVSSYRSSRFGNFCPPAQRVVFSLSVPSRSLVYIPCRAENEISLANFFRHNKSVPLSLFQLSPFGLD